MKMDTTSLTHSMMNNTNENKDKNITGLKNLPRKNITKEQGCIEGVVMGVLPTPELALKGVIPGPMVK